MATDAMATARDPLDRLTGPAGARRSPDLAALLRDVIAELARQSAEQAKQAGVLTEIVALLRRGRGPRDEADQRLLVGILEAIGDHPFTSSELIEHARVNQALGSVLLGADVVDAHSLGCVLRRLHGSKIRGLRLERTAIDRSGARWRVVLCGDGEDPSSHNRAG
jgi:hypothetical protein